MGISRRFKEKNQYSIGAYLICSIKLDLICLTFDVIVIYIEIFRIFLPLQFLKYGRYRNISKIVK